MKGKKRAVLLVLLLMAVLLLAAFDVRLRVVTYEVTSDEVSAPVRLAVLTDLHSCAYGQSQHTLLDTVAAQAPDAVLLGGDIVDDVLPEDNAWTTVKALAETYPCAYVTGNHEWWSGEVERICQQMEDLGVAVLRGGSVAWELNSQTITVFGIDDPDSGKKQLKDAGTTVNENTFTALLAHRPENIESYLDYPFDLIVSGHAHGGQWRIPGVLNGLYAPNQGMFPQYAGGRYDFDGRTFIVSRGLARESTKLPRIFNRPELVVIEILPAEQQ
ncbi:metallophosphoesterase [Dysosmobacter sp.]|uniref:metallophosphoesterase n=1 Tax=Dysosmobacter sp. TaxID=2591382 RepID=UPI002A871E5D|nr:metallophosphoesterase [Dysosmobacter sp.]MDY3985606.1 metallophosphoesterase [Dysosmobacter sp.]